MPPKCEYTLHSLFVETQAVVPPKGWYMLLLHSLLVETQTVVPPKGWYTLTLHSLLVETQTVMPPKGWYTLMLHSLLVETQTVVPPKGWYMLMLHSLLVESVTDSHQSPAKTLYRQSGPQKVSTHECCMVALHTCMCVVEFGWNVLACMHKKSKIYFFKERVHIFFCLFECRVLDVLQNLTSNIEMESSAHDWSQTSRNIALLVLRQVQLMASRIHCSLRRSRRHGTSPWLSNRRLTCSRLGNSTENRHLWSEVSG